MEIEKLFKDLKANEVKTGELPTMTNRILPKRDFQNMLEHDRIYLGVLQQGMEFAVIQQDVLRKKSQSILTNQTKEKIEKNIDILVRWAKTKKECLDLQAQIVMQQNLVTDKSEHFKAVFLPQYEKECKDMVANFDKVFKDADEIHKSKEAKQTHKDIWRKLNSEIHWFDALPKDQKTNEEYKLQLYKPIKRLVNKFKESVEV